MGDNLRLSSCIPVPQIDRKLQDIIEKAKDWAVMHGAALRFDIGALQFAPFTLLPSTFPNKEFQSAVEIQPILNKLIHKVAFSHAFLEESLKYTIQGDNFIGNLYNIYEIVRKEGFNPLSVGLLRSDMMLQTMCCNKITNEDQPYCCWKQVEVNTISTAGFGWMGTAARNLHRCILEDLGEGDKINNVPENKAIEGVSEGIIKAWKLFGNLKATILMVVEDTVYNICDQRHYEFKIAELSPQTKVMRRTLSEIADCAKLDTNKNMIIDGELVAVVYYRSGYEPSHYHSDKEWAARLLAERSSAIKCPSIHYQLAGTKKVQQSLTKPAALEQFLSVPEQVDVIRAVFTGLYSFDFDEQGEIAVSKALESPQQYVLKPQREGGGNNVYGEEIRDVILSMKSSKERTGWILMDRIIPPVQENIIIRPGQPPCKVDVVSELGIFGFIIGDSENIIYNKQVGHIFRTKPSHSDEAGVALGSGAMDSPYLV